MRCSQLGRGTDYSFPDLRTFKELGYADVEFDIRAGLFAQKALPAPIMTRFRE